MLDSNAPEEAGEDGAGEAEEDGGCLKFAAVGEDCRSLDFQKPLDTEYACQFPFGTFPDNRERCDSSERSGGFLGMPRRLQGPGEAPDEAKSEDCEVS